MRWLREAVGATGCLFAAAAVLLCALPAASAQPVRPTGLLTVTLLAGPKVGVTPGTFWAISGHTTQARGWATDGTIQSYLNQSPFRWVRLGQGSDNCNITTNQEYNDSGVVTGGCDFNVSAFKGWCFSLNPHCHWIAQLPGENNNSGEDAYIAKWYVNTEGITPDYWSIGNEPSNWNHYGEPWTAWRISDNNAPTAIAYAVEVRNVIAAVKAALPSARFIGVEAAGPANVQMLRDVALLDGPNVSAIAYHDYPNAGATPTLAQFYGILTTSNVSMGYSSVRSTISGQCPTCSTMPIFLNEWNSGPVVTGSTYSQQYPDAVFLAASAVQALLVNVSQYTPFTLQDGAPFGMVNPNDTVNPTGLVFSEVLSSVVMGAVRADSLAPGVGNAWVVQTANGSENSLLVVNANLSWDLSIALASLPTGAGANEYSWGPSEQNAAVATVTIPGSILVPSQGMLLLNWNTPASLSPSGGSGGTSSNSSSSAIAIAGSAAWWEPYLTDPWIWGFSLGFALLVAVAWRAGAHEPPRGA